MTQAGFGFEDGSTNEQDRRLEVDRTPPAVVRQGLRRLRREVGATFAYDERVRVVDPCAGSGVFAQEFRRTWQRHTNVELLGIELRESERQWLEFHHDHAIIGDAISEVEKLEDESVELAIGNPAFSLLTPAEGRSLIDTLAPKISCGGAIMMLGLNELGSRGEASRDLWKRCPPCHQWRIGGTLKFRVGVNPKNGKPWTADMRSYSWWVWRLVDGEFVRQDDDEDDEDQDEDRPPVWLAEDLTVLSAGERQWKIKPGREPR